MIKCIRLSLALFLTLLTIFPSATAFAQVGQTTFLPGVYGYIEPQAPPVTEPTPFNINPHDLVIVPADIEEYDFDVTQDEVIQLTDGLRTIGVVRGYITYMENEEEDIDKGPFVLGSFALVFMNEEQAQAFLDESEQSFIEDGLSEYWRSQSQIVYVVRETIQGFHILYSYGLARQGNVIVSTYSIDIEGRQHPSTYIGWMLNKLNNGRSSARETVADNAPDAPVENSTTSSDVQAWREIFKVIRP